MFLPIMLRSDHFCKEFLIVCSSTQTHTGILATFKNVHLSFYFISTFFQFTKMIYNILVNNNYTKAEGRVEGS